MSPNFHAVSLYKDFYSQPFSSYRRYWNKCTEDPKMTLDTKMSKVLIYIAQLPQSPTFLHINVHLMFEVNIKMQYALCKPL